MIEIPLTKIYEPEDYANLPLGFSQLLDEVRALEGQHEQRRWEYMMALEAIRRWRDRNPLVEPSAYDVGGAGSNFHRAIDSLGTRVQVIDPNLDGKTVEMRVAEGAEPRDLVISISTIEHVKDDQSFLQALAQLTKPGGLIFLTADYCGNAEHQHWKEDKHHFNWMRERVYDGGSWVIHVAMPLIRRGFDLFEELDLLWKAPQIYDYSAVSLAMVKR